MTLQNEAVAHSEIVGGGQTTLHSHPGGGEMAMSNRLPTGNITIASNYSALVVGDFEIPSGYVLDLLDNSIFEIS